VEQLLSPKDWFFANCRPHSGSSWNPFVSFAPILGSVCLLVVVVAALVGIHYAAGHWAFLTYLLGPAIHAIAPPPRSRKVGTIGFVNNTFGTDLYGPQGGLPLETYSGLIIDLNGTLTIAGGTVDGVPVLENPRTLIKAIQIQVTGLTAGDSFIDVPLTDLVTLSHFIETRPPFFPTESSIQTGAAGTYLFGGKYLLPFIMPDMQNPWKGMFPSGRSGQTKIRVQFGQAEDLVAGGDRTKTISLCQVDFWGDDIYSLDPRYDALTGLLLHQRVNLKQISLGANGTAQTDFDIEIQRTPAFLRGLLLRTMTIDANGVETPVDTVIRDTDPITMFLNEGERKFEFTGSLVKYRNRKHYNLPRGQDFPLGFYFLDLVPSGEEGLLINMMNYQTIKVRINNAAIANSAIRVVALKYANLPF
jgi:hypothetical protein